MREGLVFGVIAICLGGLVLLGYAACSRDPGRQIYMDSGCARCHGADLSGASLGPPLKALKYTWTREELVRFLENPPAYRAQDPRLEALAKRYRTPMPTFAMSEETRQQLAEFLLNHPD